MADQRETDGAKPVAIVGAGLAGALLACYLGRARCPTAVCEKRPDPRSGTAEQGRSINLALSTRGIHALAEVGLADEVIKNGVVMRGRMIHALDGALTFQPYGKDESEVLHSVSRAGLNRLLIEAAARYDSVSLHFQHRCIGLDPQGRGVEFVDAQQGKIVVEAAAIIGADGAYSAVRSWMLKRDGFNYRQDYLTHGYKELTISTEAGHHLQKHALHIWPRGSFMMIALPNLDGSFTCTLFWPLEGPNSFAALRTEAEVLAFFRAQFPDAVPLLPRLGEEFLNNPTGALVTIRCQPWRMGRAVLVGDACHAVVPFLGQGMNAAFEDCAVLHDCLVKHAWNWDAACSQYEALRKTNTDALADLCIENFVEMRDRVASPLFVLSKRLAVLLHWLLPRWYLPLYTMIEFTRIPYADAVKRAKLQSRIVIVCLVAVLVAITAATFLFWSRS